jgi:hypothetical protein
MYHVHICTYNKRHRSWPKYISEGLEYNLFIGGHACQVVAKYVIIRGNVDNKGIGTGSPLFFINAIYSTKGPYGGTKSIDRLGWKSDIETKVQCPTQDSNPEGGGREYPWAVYNSLKLYPHHVQQAHNIAYQ